MKDLETNDYSTDKKGKSVNDEKNVGDGFFDVDIIYPSASSSRSKRYLLDPDYQEEQNNDRSLGFGLISLIVIIFFLLIGVGYYFLKEYQRKEVLKLQDEGSVYINNGEYDKAIETYNKIIDVNYSNVANCASYMVMIGVNMIRDNNTEIERLCKKAETSCEDKQNDVENSASQQNYYDTCR